MWISDTTCHSPATPKAYQVVIDICHQLGVIFPLCQVLGCLGGDQAQPEPRIIDAQVIIQVEILAVIEQNDVKIEGGF